MINENDMKSLRNMVNMPPRIVHSDVWRYLVYSIQHQYRIEHMNILNPVLDKQWKSFGRMCIEYRSPHYILDDGFSYSASWMRVCKSNPLVIMLLHKQYLPSIREYPYKRDTWSKMAYRYGYYIDLII